MVGSAWSGRQLCSPSMPHQLHLSLVQSAALGSCSMVAAGGSGQGSGVQCSAHHLKVPAPEVQSFWSFIYYNPLFFFLFVFSPCPILLKKIKFFGCFQVSFLRIFLLSSERVGNMVVHGPLLYWIPRKRHIAKIMANSWEEERGRRGQKQNRGP